MIPSRMHVDFIALRRRVPWAGIAVLVASLAVAGDLTLRWREAQITLRGLNEAQALLGTPQPLRELPQRDLAEQRKTAERVVQALTVPWAAVIGALEGAALKDVPVLQIEPDAEKRLLRITAETGDERHMFQYLRAVSASRGLTEVHLVSEQERDDDPGRPIRFSVQASFKGMR